MIHEEFVYQELPVIQFLKSDNFFDILLLFTLCFLISSAISGNERNVNIFNSFSTSASTVRIINW